MRIQFISEIDDRFVLGHNNVVEVLLRNGANVRAENRYKGQPIHKAADEGMSISLLQIKTINDIFSGSVYFMKVQIPF